MIISMSCEKGGAGKTTIATNVAAILAEKGYDVLLLDSDTQPSGSYWATLRELDEENNLPPLTGLEKTGLVHKEVLKLKDKYDHIIIDAGGRDSEEMRSSLLIANLWLIPVKVSQFDTWTLSKIKQIYKEVSVFNEELRPCFFLNDGDTNAKVNEWEELRVILDDLGMFEDENMSLAKAFVSHRKSFRKAAAMGMGVTELPKPTDSDKKAAEEMRSLVEEVIINEL